MLHRPVEPSGFIDTNPSFHAQVWSNSPPRDLADSLLSWHSPGLIAFVLLRTVSTGHGAFETTLCAVAIGRWVAAPGNPLERCTPRTTRSAFVRLATSRIFSAGEPCSTANPGEKKGRARLALALFLAMRLSQFDPFMTASTAAKVEL